MKNYSIDQIVRYLEGFKTGKYINIRGETHYYSPSNGNLDIAIMDIRDRRNGIAAAMRNRKNGGM